jgi:hypothetical protein
MKVRNCAGLLGAGLIAASVCLAACGSDKNGTPSDTPNAGGDDEEEVVLPPARNVGEYFDTMLAWASVPEPAETVSEPVAERRTLRTSEGNTHGFDCQVVQHDIVSKHDEILNLDSGSAYVRPGMILVGSEFKQGNLQPVPLRRAPIRLSINVPGVANATVTVEDPNVSNIQQGIATLQAEAEAAAGDSYAAQLSYEQHTVQSLEEMAYKLGVSGSFDGGLVSGGFSAKFANEESEEKYTVVSKLMQQMYTITFAQDSFPTVRDFFASDIALDELEQAEETGFMSRTNVPVFIGSVTYGRMVVFTATSTRASSSSELEANLHAAGTTWSANADLSLSQKEFLSSLDVEVLSIGGNQGSVTNAIKTGNWSELYDGADILNSVPLRYTVYALSGTRPIAAIGDTTRFSSANCNALEGWYSLPAPAGVQLTDVSTNPTNDPVMLVGRKQGVSAPYRLVGEELVPVLDYTSTQDLDIAVDDAGNTFLYDPANLTVRRLAVGGATWEGGTAADGSAWLVFDAGAPNSIVSMTHTYSDNQNDLWRLTWGGSWGYWLDEVQNMKVGAMAAPYFSAVGDGYIGRHGGGLYRRFADGLTSEISADTADLDQLVFYSAASPSEIYAISTGGRVRQFNADSVKFDIERGSPEGKAVTRLEASSNQRLWAITSDGQLYSFVPPR